MKNIILLTFLFLSFFVFSVCSPVQNKTRAINKLQKAKEKDITKLQAKKIVPGKTVGLIKENKSGIVSKAKVNNETVGSITAKRYNSFKSTLKKHKNRKNGRRRLKTRRRGKSGRRRSNVTRIKQTIEIADFDNSTLWKGTAFLNQTFPQVTDEELEEVLEQLPCEGNCTETLNRCPGNQVPDLNGVCRDVVELFQTVLDKRWGKHPYQDSSEEESAEKPSESSSSSSSSESSSSSSSESSSSSSSSSSESSSEETCECTSESSESEETSEESSSEETCECTSEESSSEGTCECTSEESSSSSSSSSEESPDPPPKPHPHPPPPKPKPKPRPKPHYPFENEIFAKFLKYKLMKIWKLLQGRKIVF